MKKNKSIKWKLIATSIVCVIIALASLSYLYSLNFKEASNHEFTFTIINTSETKRTVETFLYNGSEDNYRIHGYYPTLNPNQSHTYHFKIKESDNIFKLLIVLTILTEDMWRGEVYDHTFYHFPDGQLHNILAIIDRSGQNLTVIQAPKPRYITNVDFSDNTTIIFTP